MQRIIFYLIVVGFNNVALVGNAMYIKNPHQQDVMGVFVARRGFEPRQTESKSVVLPLYYRAMTGKQAAKIGNFKSFPN